MAKLRLCLCLIATCLVSFSVALPKQYRYYPPAQNRFDGWTVTSQELLALPSSNDPANIVRVAPPSGFLRRQYMSRSKRSVLLPSSHPIFSSTLFNTFPLN